MNSKIKYDRIKPSGAKIGDVYPQAYFPTPHEGNYMEGYITRYFAQERGGTTPPIEIDKKSYRVFQQSPYWKFTQLNWRIVGKLTDTYTTNSDGAVIRELSVPHSNQKAINEASKRMPDLKLYLVNLTQFYKEDK